VKTYRLVLTPRAGRELDGILDEIAEEAGVATARRWGGRIDDQLRRLRDFPFAGMADQDLPGHRRLIIAPYVVIYRVIEPDNVFVLRVLYGRRDLASILKSDLPPEDDA